MEHASTYRGTRGQSVILVLILLTLVAAILGMLIVYLATHLNFTARTVGSASAQSMADSGVEYALHQLRYGDWLSRSKPFRYSSPRIGRVGQFQLEIDESDGGGEIRIRSAGRDSFTGVTRVVVATVASPAFTGYLLSVVNRDHERHDFGGPTTTVFGSDGVAASGMIQETHTIPAYPIMALLATTDPAFGGIAPGTDYIRDNSGFVFSRSDKLPLGKGRYYVDYATGQVQFSQDDVGRRVVVIYDYLRLLSNSSTPVLILPYAPVRELSEEIPGMRRVPGPPTGKGMYRIDYMAGTLTFSDQDKGQRLGIRHALLGTRMTGPVRVNGSIEFHNTNLLYLIGSEGERLATSGRIRYGPQCKVTVWNDDGRFADARSWTGRNGLVQEQAPEFSVGSMDLSIYRRRAERDSATCILVNNPEHVEFSDLQRKVKAASSAGDREKGFDWGSYMSRLYHDWSVSGSDNWHNGIYEPPAESIDLSSVFGKLRGDRGLVFADGNVILRGGLQQGKQLVVVSARNIYIEDNLGSTPTSSLTLVAEGNVCINLSRMQPQQSGGSPLTLYVNAVVYAKRGTLGVIPGAATNNQAIMHGAFCINYTYPNSEWARAFSAIDWIHDPSFSKPPRLPVDLLTIRSWGE